MIFSSGHPVQLKIFLIGPFLGSMSSLKDAVRSQAQSLLHHAGSDSDDFEFSSPQPHSVRTALRSPSNSFFEAAVAESEESQPVDAEMIAVPGDAAEMSAVPGDAEMSSVNAENAKDSQTILEDETRLSEPDVSNLFGRDSPACPAMEPAQPSESHEPKAKDNQHDGKLPSLGSHEFLATEDEQEDIDQEPPVMKRPAAKKKTKPAVKSVLKRPSAEKVPPPDDGTPGPADGTPAGDGGPGIPVDGTPAGDGSPPHDGCRMKTPKSKALKRPSSKVDAVAGPAPSTSNAKKPKKDVIPMADWPWREVEDGIREIETEDWKVLWAGVKGCSL